MDTIGPTFKKLRERVSSLENPATVSNSIFNDEIAAMESHLKRKRRGSTDDPFYEKVKSTHLDSPQSPGPEIQGTSASDLSGTPFIRDQNLRSSASKERTPYMHSSASSTSAVQQQELRHGIVTEEATLTKDQHSNSSSRVGQLDTAASRVLKPDAEQSSNGPLMKEQEHEGPDEEEDVALEILEEMHKLEESFPVLAERYRLLDKIGEGTFSTVYKAEAVDGTVMLGSQLWKSPPLQKITGGKPTKRKKKNPLVALKQIYVTSSPNRIHNELNLLFTLSGNSHVAPLLDILRFQDQVLAILPYYQHADFRDFYRDIPLKGIKKYTWELLQGLEFVHSKGIIHRDLKPTNFLYDPFKGKGVLVDFGLAEKMPSPSSYRSSNTCPCLSHEKSSINKVYSKRLNIKAAYPKSDQRPPRRANRAGTRGFRAPEVLFKCTNQSTKIDIWSVGVIGLSLLARKFPLFNSPDDIDALIEIILTFGVEKTQKCAELHGCGLEINLPSVQSTTFNGNLVKFVSTVLSYENENECLPSDSVIHDTLKYIDTKTHTLVKPTLQSSDGDSVVRYKHELEGYNDLKQLVQLLYGCFSLDPTKRLAASQLLKLPFFVELEVHQDDEILL